jgi:hypothetical protein
MFKEMLFVIIKFFLVAIVSLFSLGIGMIAFMIYEENQFHFSCYKKNGKILTKVRSQGQNYLCVGYYSSDSIPQDCVQPLYSGWSEGFSCYGKWEGDTCYINNAPNRLLDGWKVYGKPKIVIRDIEMISIDTINSFYIEGASNFD